MIAIQIEIAPSTKRADWTVIRMSSAPVKSCTLAEIDCAKKLLDLLRKFAQEHNAVEIHES